MVLEVLYKRFEMQRRVPNICAGLLVAACYVLPFPVLAKDLNALSDSSPHVVKLPKGLTEISGLAVASDQTIYAHNDEHGIIFEVNVSTGEPRSIFAIGNPTIASDFEGIATHENRVYLINSDGVLYESTIGLHQQRVKFNAYDTGIGDVCEVEGLTAKSSEHSEDASFLILCKSPRQPEYKDRLTIFEWSLDQRLTKLDPFLSLDRDLILTKKEQKKFKPSAIEWHKESRSIFVISGQNRRVIQLSEDGNLLSKQRLEKALHPQSEGLTIMPNGDWVVSDEGQGLNPGTLTRYLANP